MTDPRIDRADTLAIDRTDVAAERQELLLAAARWWRLEARLAQALADTLAQASESQDESDLEPGRSRVAR
ncbi:MAG TPA: hypothetical protein VI341_04560 [Actinomycetota bacterium]